MSRPARSWSLRSAPLERLYLWLAIPMGLFFAFANPPFGGVPDELGHYFKALALAQGQLTPARQTTAPTNYVYLRVALAPGELQEGYWPRVDWAAVLRALTTGASEAQAPVPARVGNAYPFGFLPQALGLKIALLCRAPPLVAFYLGRLLAFAVAVALVHSAIRVAPSGKIVFTLVGLLPMSLQQLASFSYDALHIGAIFLFTAYALAVSQKDRPLTSGEKLAVIGLSLSGSLIKPGYPLIACLVFLLPRRLFRSPGAHGTFLLGSLLASAAALWVGRVVFHEEVPPGTQVDPGAQAWYILAHPLGFFGTFVKTLPSRVPIFWEALIFRSGRAPEGAAPLVYGFAWLGVVLLLRSHDESVRLTRAQRIVLLGTALAQALLVFLSAYLLWTPVGRGHIQGVQGRYFLVLLPLVVLSFYKSDFHFRSAWVRRHPNAALLAFTLIVFACVIVEIWRLYY